MESGTEIIQRTHRQSQRRAELVADVREQATAGAVELPQLLGSKPVRSHLVHALVQLDRDYTAAAPDERWEDWYAERLAERVAPV